MFRIRLTSGEDTVFRSVEELALGIQSGVITPDAQVFHAPSQRWRPITTEPEYAPACRRASALPVTADPDPLPLPALIEPAGTTTVPIYQMFSRSARELAERRRPEWVVPAATIIVGLVLIVVVMLIPPPRSSGSDPAVRIAGSVPHPPPAAPRSGPILSEEAVRAARDAPYNVVARFARAIDSTNRSLAEGGSRLDLSRLLHPDRLGSEAALRAGRGTLATFDSIVQECRRGQRRLDSTYRDSARSFARRGIWSGADVQEWRLRAPRLESPGEAARADSIIRSLDRLYQLLLSEQGSVTVTPVALRFIDGRAGTTYDSLRAVLLRQLSAGARDGEHPAGPLTLLLKGIGDPTLPPRNPR